MEITSRTLTSGKIGQTYTEILSATGGVAPLTWTLEKGSLPLGLTLGPDGVISGTPSSAGVTTFLVQVTDSTNPPQTSRELFSLPVEASLRWPAWLNPYLPAIIPGILWKVPYLVVSGLLVLVAYLLTLNKHLPETQGQQAIAFWSGTGFGLLLLFFLGAARTPRDFLAMFATSGFGAASGYLIAVFITATGSESSNLSQIGKIVTGALTGVVGTKLLSLWDDLTKGDSPKIFSLGIYLQLIAGLIGFTLSLAAFYTVRSLEAGTVSITAPPGVMTPYQSADKTTLNGIKIPPSGSVDVQFTGAAVASDDMAVTWKIASQPSSKSENAADGSSYTVNLQDNGKLEVRLVPTATPPPSPVPIDWVITATSRRNTSNSADFKFRLCVLDTDCPPVKP